jgi:hypothetical protein
MESNSKIADNEFIDLVRLKPVLYDKTNKLYPNNLLKGRIWEAIAKEAGYESILIILEIYY